MLAQIEGRYGSKSGVVRQLNTLMQENDQMRKLAQFSKLSNNQERKQRDKQFLEKNYANAFKPK